MKCTNCGHLNDENSIVCDECHVEFDIEHVTVSKQEFKRTKKWISKALLSALIIAGVLMLYGLYSIITNRTARNIMAEYRDLMSNSSVVLFYFGSDTEKQKISERYADNYDFDFLQIEPSIMTRSHKREIISDLNLINLDSVFAIVLNGEILSSKAIKETEEISSFLYENGLIAAAFVETASILEKFRNAMTQDVSVIYLITTENDETIEHSEFLHSLSNSYEFDYARISGYHLSMRQQLRIMLHLGFSEVQENMLLIVRDGEVVKIIHEGDVEIESYFDIFISYGIIDSESEQFLTRISVNRFEQIIQRGDLSVVVIGTDNCAVCSMLAPIAGQVAMLNDIVIYYLDATNSFDRVVELLDSISDQTALRSFPSTIILERGHVIDYMIGFIDRQFLIERLTENGIIR